MIRIRDIMALASRLTGVSAKDMVSARRDSEFIKARAAVIFTSRQRGFSFPAIGRALGGRDHSTIIHAYSHCDVYCRRWPDFGVLIAQLTSAIAEAESRLPDIGKMVEEALNDGDLMLCAFLPEPEAEPAHRIKRRRNSFAPAVGEGKRDHAHRFHERIGTASAKLLAALTR